MYLPDVTMLPFPRLFTTTPKKVTNLIFGLTGEDAYVTDDNLVIDGTEKNAVANGNLSFAEINKILASFDPDSATDVAALCYASGVMTKSNFSSTETSTYGTVKDIFIRVGFESAFSATKNQGSDFWNGNNLSDKGWNKIVSNMENNRPIFASIPNPGHVVVIDGYDAKTKKVHINYGWGILNGKRYHSEHGLVEGSGWYTRSECDSLGLRELIYDIIPSSPKDLQLTELSTTTSPTTADNMVLYSTIKNNGPNASGASKAYIYENNVKIGELSVDSLAAGESRKCSTGDDTITISNSESDFAHLDMGSGADKLTISNEGYMEFNDYAPQSRFRLYPRSLFRRWQ